VFARGTFGTRRTRQTTTFATTAIGGGVRNWTTAVLSTRAVAGWRLWHVFQVADLAPDVLGGALAELHLVLHLVSDVAHIVVHHGQRDAH